MCLSNGTENAEANMKVFRYTATH